MKKFLIPAALLVASTLGGTAFAGSISQAEQAENEALYDRPNPFAAVWTAAPHQVASALDMGSQQASRSYVLQSSWVTQAPAAGENHRDPE